MPGIGPMELVIVLVLALVILGPKRLPEAGRSLGRGMREFKQALTTSDEPAPPPRREPDAEAPPRAEQRG